MELVRLSLSFNFSLATLVPCLSAHMADSDELLRRRAEESMKATNEAYSPEAVINYYNTNVRKFLEGNRMRRKLLRHEKHNGPCVATNPIDRCWRCQKDWANNRHKLAECALGFGKHATGGKHGPIYTVTDSSDDQRDHKNPKPGTLRHAVTQKGPLWIIFERDMNIKLSKVLQMTSDKTIDGRGADVHIAHGGGIGIHQVKNVIIHGLHIHNIVHVHGSGDGDGISMYGSSNVWVDHVSMSQCHDGLIDATQGSTAITISNSHFTKHDKVMLLGASDTFEEDKKMKVTIAYNHFDRELVQRMPRIRFGFVHVVNNDSTHWKMYALCGLKNPIIISQGNRFVASYNDSAKQVTKRDACSKYDEIWRSEGDIFANGAFFNQSGDPNWKIPFLTEKEMIKAEPGTSVEWLTRFAGVLKCSPVNEC